MKMKLWRITMRDKNKKLPGTGWNIFMFNPACEEQDVVSWAYEKFGNDLVSVDFLREEEVEA